jgi:hypothetical protein
MMRGAIVALCLLLAAPVVVRADDAFQSAPAPQPAPPKPVYHPRPEPQEDQQAPAPLAMPQPGVPPSSVHPFDGIWVGQRTCPASSNGAPGFVNGMSLEIKSGEISIMVTAPEGQPGHTEYSGTVSPSGNFTIHARGLASGRESGSAQPRGQPFSDEFIARFENGELIATMKGRACTLRLSRRQ